MELMTGNMNVYALKEAFYNALIKEENFMIKEYLLFR